MKALQTSIALFSLSLLACSGGSNPGDGLEFRNTSQSAYVVTDGTTCSCSELASSSECTLKAPRITVKNFKLGWKKADSTIEIIAVLLKYSIDGLTYTYPMPDEEIKSTLNSTIGVNETEFTLNNSNCGLKFGNLKIPSRVGPFVIPAKLVVKGIVTSTVTNDEYTAFIENELTINGEIF